VTTQPALILAARMGARAGQSFLDTGMWPRCPFRTAALADVALVWTRAVFNVTGPALRPAPGYWSSG
jgi:hypothetical protein